VVTFAGWNSGGYGNLMVVRHRLGFETWYAHLSGFAVGRGTSVAGGVRIGYVGSTGRSTGPHLHFEVRHGGAPINPMPYLLSATSLKPFAAKAEPMGLECSATPRLGGVRGDSADPRNAVLEPCGGDD
jgi:murein DD-endopeptidase MepM/ murein hydrolase activator NlpD